jgi:hypothetical protein
MGTKRAIVNDAQTYFGKDNWRFIFRDYGQKIKTADYAEIKVGRVMKVAEFAKNRKRVLSDALKELHAGRFIQGETLIKLCGEHNVKISKNVLFQLKYMNMMDVSIKTIRHKNERGTFPRKSFTGVFSVVTYLIAETIDLVNGQNE